MATVKSLQARYARWHNIGMAVVAVTIVAVAVGHFIANPANAPTLSLNDPRFALFAMLGLAMLSYGYLGVSRARNRQPQVVIDRDGIALGFGRDRRLSWDDIQWVRLKRLALRPQLLVGVAPQAFIAADLRLSMWNLDDALRPVRGIPAAVLVRDNGLDASSMQMLDAVRAFRPNLVKS